jgi:hypothetical protein
MKQISVFLEKKPGRLYEITSLLAEEKISLKAVTLSEGSDFGILRIITDEVVKSAEILEKNGFSLRVVDVLAVEIDDEVGAFSKIAGIFAKNGIDIEYCYTLNSDKKGAFVFKVNNFKKAKALLEENSIGVK